MKVILFSYILKFNGFITTFKNLQVERKENIYDTLKWLAHVSRKYATKYDGYLINGCIFHVKSIENVRATQNSGMCIDA